MKEKADITTTNNFYKALDTVFNNKSVDEKSDDYYVYFNKSMSVVCITPQEDESLNKDFQYARFPYKQVEGFISGEDNPSQYVLEKKKGSQTEYKFKTKILQVNHIRTVEQFLSEVTDNCEDTPHLIIKNNIKERKLTLILDNELRKELTGGHTEEINESQINVKGIREINLYFTTKDDPCFLIDTVNVSLPALIVQQTIEIPYKTDLEYTSLFTKKLFDHYMYVTHEE